MAIFRRVSLKHLLSAVPASAPAFKMQTQAEWPRGLKMIDRKHIKSEQMSRKSSLTDDFHDKLLSLHDPEESNSGPSLASYLLGESGPSLTSYLLGKSDLSLASYLLGESGLSSRLPYR